MQVVVIGGYGLFGSKLCSKLTEHGNEAAIAAPDTGVNTLSDDGPAATHFGIALTERTLLPGEGARLGTVQLSDCLADAAKAA